MRVAKTRFETRVGEALTQEFHICVTPVGQDNYLVRTQQVAPGVPAAQELVQLPVADWLTQLNAESQSDRSLLLPQTSARDKAGLRNFVNLGQQLYTALFQGKLRDSWTVARTIAQQRREKLRLRLGLEETSLNSLPWELLHTGDRFLITDSSITFSRYQADATPLAYSCKENISVPTLPLPPDVLKVLMVIATATEQVSFALKQEAIRLQIELCQLQCSDSGTTDLEFTLLEHPSLEQLLRAIEQENYQIIHYVGQSDLVSSSKQPYLRFGTIGCAERVNADELASLLSKNGIQMVVFNFCRHTYTENFAHTVDITEAELTQRLVNHGIKSVLRMGKCLPDEATLTLMHQFYYNLSQGSAVDFSLSQVREELFCVYGVDQLYWASPILYLQPESDGYLTTSETFDLVDNYNEFDSSEEMWEDLVDQIKDDDPTYQADSAVVADLFSQLANPAETEEIKSQKAKVKSQKLEEIKSQKSKVKSQNSEDRIVSPGAKVLPCTPVIDISPSLSSRGSVQAERTATHTPGILLSITGTSAIALLGLWWQYQQPQLQDFLPPIYQSLLAKPYEIKLKTASASNLTAIAIEKFQQADLSGGYLAVEELLNQGELQNASIALAAVSPQQAETGEINFLRGRLVWQSVKLGDKNYNLEDAYLYWEAAVKSKPDSALYYNALGFAYYTAGNLERANQRWFQSLYLVQEQQAAKSTNSSIPATATLSTDQIALNAYAGLALVIHKAALNQPLDKQVNLISEAIKLRQKVLKDDPVKFQSENLSKNWLWTNQTIQDWRSLLQQSSEE